MWLPARSRGNAGRRRWAGAENFGVKAVGGHSPSCEIASEIAREGRWPT
jgi:hypothetical protein